MTVQFGELLVYKDVVTAMTAEPLRLYLLARPEIEFVAPSTACWRGYLGRWEIKNNKLYLIGLKATLKGFKKVGIDYLFPGQEEVFADWFTGTIEIPKDEMQKYIHSVYESKYDKILRLDFFQGKYQGNILVDN